MVDTRDQVEEVELSDREDCLSCELVAFTILGRNQENARR